MDRFCILPVPTGNKKFRLKQTQFTFLFTFFIIFYYPVNIGSRVDILHLIFSENGQHFLLSCIAAVSGHGCLFFHYSSAFFIGKQKWSRINWEIL